MAKAKAKATLEQARESSTAGPDPVVAQHHTWSSISEYEAQIALPVHVVGPLGIRASDGEPGYDTLCGVELGSEILRISDVSGDLTCVKCKRRLSGQNRKKR